MLDGGARCFAGTAVLLGWRVHQGLVPHHGFVDVVGIVVIAVAVWQDEPLRFGTLAFAVGGHGLLLMTDMVVGGIHEATTASSVVAGRRQASGKRGIVACVVVGLHFVDGWFGRGDVLWEDGVGILFVML